MKTVFCTATKSWVTCTPEIETAMARGEVVRVDAGAARGRPNNADAIAEAVVNSFRKQFREQFTAGLLAARNERADRLRAALGTLSDEAVADAVHALQAERRAAGEELSFKAATKEVLAGREDEFMEVQMREMNAPHEARMRTFDRGRPAPGPSLAEREAAVENDPTIHAEAEKMSHERGVNVLEALRTIARGRELDARIAAAKKGA